MKILWILLCIVAFSLPANGEAKTFKVDLRSEESSMPRGEKFFFTYKASILPDVNFANLEMWEKKVGALKKETPKTTRNIELSKIPELGISEGNKLVFFNSYKNALENYVFKKEISIQIIPSPIDTEYFYTSFNLLLTPPKNIEVFNHTAHQRYDGMAYLGAKYELNVEPFKYYEPQNISAKDPEIQKLLEEHFSLTKSDMQVGQILIKNKKILIFGNENTNERTYFLRVSPDEYIRWNQPMSEYESINYFGDFVKGSELSLIYELAGTYYLILLYKDKIEKLQLLHKENYKG